MSDNLTLYGITEEMSTVDALLDMDQGEFNENTHDRLQAIEDALILKTDSVVGYIKREGDLIKIATQRIKELQDYKKAKEAKIQRFKEYVKMCIEKTGQEKFVGTINSIKLRKSTQIVNIVNEDDLPLQYLTEKTTVTIDKTLIKTDLKNGAIIPGAALIDGATSIAVGLNKGK